jgi:hypothetical protein
MLTQNPPPKRRHPKPLTKAMAQQQKSEERIKKFDQAALLVFGLMAGLLLAQAI